MGRVLIGFSLCVASVLVIAPAQAEDFVMVVELPPGARLDADQLRQKVSKDVSGTARSLGDDAAANLSKILTVVVARGGRKAVLILSERGRVIATMKVKRDGNQWLRKKSVELLAKSQQRKKRVAGSSEVIDPWGSLTSTSTTTRRHVRPKRVSSSDFPRQVEVIDPWIHHRIQSKRSRIRRSHRERAKRLSPPPPSK